MTVTLSTSRPAVSSQFSIDTYAADLIFVDKQTGNLQPDELNSEKAAA